MLDLEIKFENFNLFLDLKNSLLKVKYLKGDALDNK